MADTALVERDLAGGRELLLALDSAHFPVFAALWLFRPESEDWILYIGSPEIDSVGKHAAYARLQEILNATDSRVPLRDISLVGSSDRFLSLIAGAMVVEGISEVRVQSSMFNGVLITDALIYRLQRPPSMGPRLTEGNRSNAVPLKPKPTKRTNASAVKGRKK